MAAAVTVVGGVSLAAAPAASAVDLSAGCATVNSSQFDSTYQTAFIGARAFNAGEEINVTGASGALTLQIPVGTTVVSGTGPTTLTYLFLADATESVTWSTDGGSIAWTAECAYVGLPATPVVTDDTPPIPAWVQAFGRASEDAPCIEGWDPSWDLWPNNGTGGFVCQRSIPSLG